MIVPASRLRGPRHLHRPRFAAETARWARHLARDGAVLADDLASGKLPQSPQSSSQSAITGPSPPARRARQQLIAGCPTPNCRCGTAHRARCNSALRVPAQVPAARYAGTGLVRSQRCRADQAVLSHCRIGVGAPQTAGSGCGGPVQRGPARRRSVGSGGRTRRARRHPAPRGPPQARPRSTARADDRSPGPARSSYPPSGVRPGR